MGIPQSQNRLDCNAQVWAIKGQGRYAVVLNSKATHTIQEGTEQIHGDEEGRE